MSLRKRRNLLLLAIFHFIMLAAFLPGCKEGTKTSPVSSFVVSNDDSGLMTSAVNNVNGMVYDVSSDSPLQLAKIKVASATKAITNADGKFKFTAAQSGLHTMLVEMDGFEQFETHFMVYPNGTVVPSVISVPMVYSGLSGYGSVAGRITDPATGNGVENLFVILLPWEQVTKTTPKADGTEVTETDYEITAGAYRKTKTVSGNVDPAKNGTFCLTNVSPLAKYVLYFGRKDAYDTDGEYRPGKIASWTVIDTNFDSYYASYRDVSVATGKTTFISNFEK
ncbi:hypothetical protein MASR1M12_07360 [Erysipelotrichia bacterium]